MTDADLVRAWMEGKTCGQIAKEFGAKIATVNGRVVYLRMKGVNLPRRKRKGPDVDALNKLIKAAK